MRNDGGQRPQGSGRFLRSFSSYLRIVSNGASTVASSVRSAGASVASSIADRDEDAGRDQVLWAGFDKLECEGSVHRQVLLLGYRSGFQVWDVEDSDDVRQLVSRHDGYISFLQMLKRPHSFKSSGDKFVDERPLLAVVGDVSSFGNNNNVDFASTPNNGNVGNYQEVQELSQKNSLPTFVHIYSLRSHEYVDVLKFRTAVYSLRCSSRIVAVLQASQIHCFDSGTLEREYTILTCPIASGNLGAGIGYGPLAVGPRWFAYSGNPVAVSNTNRVTPQHLTSTRSLTQSSPNGSLVAHYAKESSKQLAAGIVTLGDIGYKKLSNYYSERLADDSGFVKHGSPSFKGNGTINSHLPDVDNSGVVIVRDIVCKSVIVQFRAHRSPIAALCFDPSGTLLVTASVNGHNINVFQIVPSPLGNSSDSDASGSCIHLYRLQRGITNAVIQDITFSDDSQWIMISSSRGTSHLFSVPSLASKTGNQCSGASKLNSQSLNPSGDPITLSAISRLRNGNGWKGTVTGAASAATGRANPLSGAIAAVFHNCKGSRMYPDFSSSRTKHYLLVFCPNGSIIQYLFRLPAGEDSGIDLSGLNAVSNGFSPESDSRLVVDALRKWDVCHKRNRKDRGDSIDVYGDNKNTESCKVLQKAGRKGTSIYPADSYTDTTFKHNAEENQHMYISEVELHMHAAQVPLWAKPEIYFQVMTDESTITDNSEMTGETEIEKIPTRTIEARSKELIPVFENIQSPSFGDSRKNHFEYSRNESLESVISGEGNVSRKNICSSVDQMSESSAAAEHLNNVDENPWCATLHGPGEINEGFVNNDNGSDDVRNELESVDNRESLKTEAHLECVNSIGSLKMENHFVDRGNENL